MRTPILLGRMECINFKVYITRSPLNTVSYCWYVGILANRAGVQITDMLPFNMGCTVEGSMQAQEIFATSMEKDKYMKEYIVQLEE